MVSEYADLYKKAVWSLYSYTCDKVQDFSQTRMRTVLFSALCGAVLAQTSVDSYVATESPIAKAGMFANIGADGSKSEGAISGIVIASPSTVNPNYLYTWVRDSSLVFKVIIDQFTTGQDTTLQDQIQNFITAETNLQQVSNPSGTVSTGGLGEPKFNVDGTAFTDPWGDGPALRSTSMITYANWLLKNTTASNVLNTIWPAIKLDLDYVAANWNQTGHRSLRQGATLATTLGQDASTYTTQADNILCFLQSYWNPSGEFITANTGGGRSGIDANTALASIHTFDPAAGCDANTFQPCSDKALSSLKSRRGRYPEDVYMGGNPWYLTTAAVAEQLYDALAVWNAQGSLSVTSTSLAFFQQFLPSVTAGTYASSTSTFSTLTAAVKDFAEGFLEIHAKYTPSGGGLAEQFDRNNGTALSAVDLTWSYAAALTVFAARAGTPTVSWGAADLDVPSVCEFGPPAPMVAVTFNVVATTVPGEDIYLTGSVEELQNWSPDTALLMSPANYPTWSITVNVPVSTDIQYKYIRKVNGVLTEWESDPNNEFTSPADGTLVLNDTWR
ncbi:Glucoamylase [Mycena sanguinolenta]|uniref:glucan 1,4-alpha-glucosidase n=1 Tax=Mycena sanguinolenta TaxID=230812 RepID=A0A8H6XY28_9AGAR|nr:Glucoamylase [Mycena sanguinolenta]